MDKENVVLYTMDCYSMIIKKKILIFVTTRMKFEGIMLSEISQTEKGKLWSHLYVELKKKKQETDWWLSEAGDGGWGKWMKVVKRYNFQL